MSRQRSQEDVIADLAQQVLLIKNVINKLNTKIIQLQSKVESLEAKIK